MYFGTEIFHDECRVEAHCSVEHIAVPHDHLQLVAWRDHKRELGALDGFVNDLGDATWQTITVSCN
ncbi:hypothetical protein D1872_313570 [compost metagenome]